MTDKEAIERLRSDEDYYGKFGQQYLSNSNIMTLLNNPADLRTPTPDNPNFKIGGYFHTKILEPEKLDAFKIVDATSRNTKKYKELSDGKVCLMKHEVENIDLMVETMLKNDICRELIKPLLGTCEEPGITEMFGNKWKGKADIINHDEKFVIDLKTTGNISKFKWSASKFNYDSQAYIYKQLFGYDMVFVVIDKTTHQLGIYNCSEKFYETGKAKVIEASAVYDKFYKDQTFDQSQHIMSTIL